MPGSLGSFLASVRFASLLAAVGAAILPLGAQQQAAPPPNQITQNYVEGQNAFAQGDYKKAIQKMEFVISKAAPDSPLESVYYTLGAAQFNLRNYAAAVGTLRTFLSKFPKSDKATDASFFLGQALIQQKEPGAAAEAFAPLEAKPEYRDRVLLMLGSAYRDAGDVDEAIKVLQKLVGGGVNSTEAANGAMLLAGLYSQKGEFDHAFDLLRTIRQKSEMLDNVVRMNSMAIELGDSLLKADKPEEALRSYQLVQTKSEVIRLQKERIQKMQQQIEQNLVAVRADPNKAADITATNNHLRSVIELTKKQLAEFEAKPDFEGPLWLRVAQANYGVDRKWQAATIYDELLRRYPSGPEREPALFGLLVNSVELNRGAKARAIAETYLKDFPDTPNANTASYLIGVSALQDQDYEAAANYFGTSLKRRGTGTYREQIMFLLGNARLSNSQFDQAVAAYKKYLEAYPSGAYREDAVYRIALAALFAGKYEEAIKEFQSYLKTFPEGQFVADAEYRLAVCKYAASDYEGVLADADTWVKKFPGDSMLGEMLSLKGDAYASTPGKEGEAIDAYIASAKATENLEVLNHALFEAAKLMQKQGDWDRIGSVFGEFIETHPTSEVVVPAVFWLGKAKVKSGKPDEAKKIVAEAIQKNIEDPSQAAVEALITQLAQLCGKKRSLSAGEASTVDPVEELDTLLDAEGQTIPVARARVLFAQSELARVRKNPEEQARFLAEIGEKFKPDELSPVLLASVGDYLLARKDYDQAAPFFQALMDNFPKSDVLDYAYNGFGEIAYARKDYPVALRYFTEAIDKAGATQKLKEVTIGQAKALLALNRLDDAEKLFKQIASTREWRGDATAYSVYSLGEIEEKRNKLAEAIAYYQRVFVAYGRYLPWVAKAYIRSAECFARLGKNQEALNTYREMLRNEKLTSFPEFEEARKKVEAAGNG